MSGMLLLAGCGASDEGKPVNPVEQLAWLRSADRSDPEVGKFLERENQASEQALTTERALQETLLDEMLARLPAYYDLDHRTAGEHRYFERWSVHHADQGELWRDTLGGGEPERLLSGVDEAAGSAYYSLGAWAVDEAEQWLAVAEDRVGNEAYTLRVRNMAEGSWQSIAGAETSTALAFKDGWLWYIAIEPETLAEKRVMRIDLNEPEAASIPVRDIPPGGGAWVQRTNDARYMCILTGVFDTESVDCLLDGRWVAIAPKRDDIAWQVDHAPGRWWRTGTNAEGQSRVETALDLDDGRPGEWTLVTIVEDLQGLVGFAHHVAIQDREEALPGLWVIDVRSGESRRLKFSAPSYTLEFTDFQDNRHDEVHYRISTPLSPWTTKSWDFVSGTSTVVHADEIQMPEAEGAIEERFWFKSHDGTRVPISLIRRAGSPSQQCGLLVTAYGAYGIPSDMAFVSTHLSLLKRGVGMATIHVRGGGEAGRAWHRAGKRARKYRGVEDFISGIDALAARGWRRDGMLGRASSAGATLVVAAFQQAPGLLRAAVLDSPFLDVIGSLSDTSLPLTLTDHAEWGNPLNPEHKRWIARYDPLSRVAAIDYPDLLVTTALHDTRVGFWESAWWTAKVRAMRSNPGPTLLLSRDSGGHHGPSSLRELYADEAMAQAFLLERVRGRCGVW
ncbi:MAG: S9 family peptidase [Xanthomonadales bacterium]|nr:S9 family peptidase [Xanthomonadales bacterium]